MLEESVPLVITLLEQEEETMFALESDGDTGIEDEEGVGDDPVVRVERARGG